MPTLRRLRPTLLPLLAVAATCALSLVPVSAHAAWRMLPNSDGPNYYEPSLLRTTEGTLHVAYRDKRGGSENLLHATLAPGGTTFSGPHTILPADWGDLTNPGLVQLADGTLAVFFAGLTGEPYTGGAAMATSADGGATWSLHPSVITDRHAYDSNEVGAAVAGDGTPFQSFSGTFGTLHHAGILATTDSVNHVDRCCGYYTALARDEATGHVLMGWHQLITGANGYWWANASAGGAPTMMPASGVMSNGALESASPSQRTSLASRAGGGVYAAYGVGYPGHKAVGVYKLGGAYTRVWKGTVDEVAIARGPGGRMWVLFIVPVSGGELVTAMRSNAAVTAWGAPVSVKLPSGRTSYRVLGEGSSGPLDVFAHIDANDTSTWHNRLLPGLTVKPSPAKVTAGMTTKVKFVVSDAGLGVPGAKVELGMTSATTNASGVAWIAITPAAKPKRIQVTATKPGYTPGSARVRVKKA